MHILVWVKALVNLFMFCSGIPFVLVVAGDGAASDHDPVGEERGAYGQSGRGAGHRLRGGKRDRLGSGIIM